jgi:heat-inducible transcriptional repressor
MPDDGKKVLTERKKSILKAIVEAHISIGEPVGSKLLTQNKQFNLSSATIRNEMAELEEMGYLEQPHTSAGRIPSESGYRFYVDSLAARYRMTAGEVNELRSLLHAKVMELDEIMAQATRLASVLTNFPALSIKSAPRSIKVVRFEALAIDEYGFVLVMITDAGIVRTRHVRPGFAVTAEEVARLTDVLNACVAGKAAEEITLPAIIEMERQMGGASSLISPVIKCVYDASSEPGAGDLRLEGVDRLLQYPEYYDIERLKKLLNLFERGDDLVNVIENEPATDRTRVIIGRENKVRVMDNSTLIYRSVTVKGRQIGAIGVIGPCRMNYSRVITLINSLTENVSEAMCEPLALPESENKDTGEE